MARPMVQTLTLQLMERFGWTHQGSKAGGLTLNLVYGLPQTLSLCKSSSMVCGPYLLCSFWGRFAVHQPGPWRQKRHFGVTNVPFLANEDVLESPRPPASITLSGAGSPGHLTCLNESTFESLRCVWVRIYYYKQSMSWTRFIYSGHHYIMPNLPQVTSARFQHS